MEISIYTTLFFLFNFIRFIEINYSKELTVITKRVINSRHVINQQVAAARVLRSSQLRFIYFLHVLNSYHGANEFVFLLFFVLSWHAAHHHSLHLWERGSSRI